MKTLPSTFFRFGLLLLALVLTACQPIRADAAQPVMAGAVSAAQSDQPQRVAEQNMAIVQRFYDEFSAGNADVILDIHPETIRMHYAGTAEEVPTQVLRDDLAAIKQANPDLRAEIHAMFAAGDIVVTELTWTTTHTGDYFGIPPTGKTTLHNGLVVRRLAQGKIVESWEMFDDLSLMQSIGYLPDWETLVTQGPMAAR